MLLDCFVLLIPILGLAINVICQVFSFRCINNKGLLKSVYLGFSAGLVFILFCEFIVFFLTFPPIVRFADSFAVNVTTYFALGYCYFHFINLGETARRIRILREIYDSCGGLSENDILEKYNAIEIIGKRFHRLIFSGQILLKDGKYYIGRPEVLVMANILSGLKRLLFRKNYIIE